MSKHGPNSMKAITSSARATGGPKRTGAAPQTKAAATRRTNRRAADIKRAEAAGFHARGIQDWVPVNALFSDPRYQRTVNKGRVNQMAAEFNPDALGVIYVSDRGNDTYAVMDGFHRVSLMRYLGWDDQKMPALIFFGLTVEEEAEIFSIMNKDRARPLPMTLFLADVTAKNPDAVELHDALIAAGLTLADNNGVGHFRAIATAQRVYKVGGAAVVRKALTAMNRVWGGLEDGMNGDVFNGIALLIYKNPTIDLKHLEERLKDATPGLVLNKAKVTKDVNPELTLPAAVARVVTTLYNSRLRARRLPEVDYRAWPKATPASSPSFKPSETPAAPDTAA